MITGNLFKAFYLTGSVASSYTVITIFEEDFNYYALYKI